MAAMPYAIHVIILFPISAAYADEYGKKSNVKGEWQKGFSPEVMKNSSRKKLPRVFATTMVRPRLPITRNKVMAICVHARLLRSRMHDLVLRTQARGKLRMHAWTS